MKTLARFSLPLWLCLAVWFSACTFDSSSYDKAKCTDDTQCAAAGMVCGSNGFCQEADGEGEVSPCSLCGSAEVCCAGVCCAADACCGEVCLDVQNDAENCGGCGIACGEDETCSAGQCLCGETLGDGGPACPSPEACCNGACTNPLFDSSCCGATKATCLSDQICYSGTCECSPGQFACEGSTGCDVDIFSDPSHCRDCDTVCDAGANPACIGGTCSCSGTVCAEGSQECCSASGTQFCIDTQDYLSNPSHCGGCGKTCVPNEVCANGTCSCHNSATPCAAGKTCCADGSCQDNCVCGDTLDCAFTCCPGTPEVCVDLTQDLNNCGGCGIVCQDPQHTCVGGACVCPAGFSNCGGVCVDVLASTTHCGTCGNSCAAGEACCRGNCIDTNTDKANCGGCGSVCNGDICAGGQCRCGGAPVDLETNSSHCGLCYNACAAPNATVACVGGACDYVNATCQNGYANCDNNMSNGCEVNKNTDVNNCGACGTVCSFAHATATCTGSCTLGACDSGWGNCDGNPANGCETSVSVDMNNCGGCGVVCTGDSCSGGQCLCGGVLKNLQTDVANCGACANNCNVANASGELCTNGACDYSSTSCDTLRANCDGNMASNGCEANLAADPNCGVCGLDCINNGACQTNNGIAGCVCNSGDRCAVGANCTTNNKCYCGSDTNIECRMYRNGDHCTGNNCLCGNTGSYCGSNLDCDSSGVCVSD